MRKGGAFVGTVLLVVVGLFGIVSAATTYEHKPFWTGIPPGGVWTECVGMGSYAVPVGFFGAGTGYAETRYSNGGFCNSWLTRPSGWIYAGATSARSNGGVCASAGAYNASGAANAFATAGTCGGVMKYTTGGGSYEHPTLSPKPSKYVVTATP